MSEEGAAETGHPGGINPDNVGRDLLTVLRNYGIDTVFGIPGTHNLELYRHLPDLGIHPVTTRHEQGAGYAADGWMRQTGLPGVVLVTSGPGLLNTLSAVGTAFAESRPMIVLAPGGDLGAPFADDGTLHETKDSRAAAEGVAEWARRVGSGIEAVEAIHDAFELFRTGRPRPVVIEVPLDVLEGESDCPPEMLEARPVPEPAEPDGDTVGRAAETLAGATRPVIVAGGGSLGAAGPLRELAEQLDAPVVTTLNGRGVIPESHPLSVGSALRYKTTHSFVNDADVLLVIGSKVGEAELWWGPLEPSGKVLRIELIESQLEMNLSADIGIVADAAAAVRKLVEALPEAGSTTGREDGRERAAAARAEGDREGREWKPAIAACCDAIAAGMPENPILGGDSSQISYFGTANFVPLESPASFLYMSTYATLGYGLPASIGAKLVSPERPVVCVLGDGALMFSVQELITAVEQKVDLVVVCVDNGGYLEIEENEAERGIDPIGVRLTQPDWPALADAFGATGVRVGDAAELPAKLREAVAAGGVRLLHVPLSLFEGGNSK